METVLEIKKLLAEKGHVFGSDPDFVRLREFYEEMKRLGLAKRQEYSLPPLDTAGQGLFQVQQEAFRAAQG